MPQSRPQLSLLFAGMLVRAALPELALTQLVPHLLIAGLQQTPESGGFLCRTTALLHTLIEAHHT